MPRPTALSLAHIKPGPKRRIIYVSEALYLVIQPSGHRSWMVRFRGPSGKPSKIVLGSVDFEAEIPGQPEIGMPLTLAAARQLANEILRQRALGRDPVADHKAAKLRQRTQIQEAEAYAFSTLARRYIDEYLIVQRKARKWRRFARQLGLLYPVDGGEPTMAANGLVQRWRDRDVRTIDDVEILSVYREARVIGTPGIVARKREPAESRTHNLHRALSSFFGWLTHPSERIVKTNPCAGLLLPVKAEPRDRVLRPEEIVKFWHACDKISVPFGAVFKLLLLTGARLNEVGGMLEDELNGDAMWELPGSRSKNRRAHQVPLPPLAVEIIASVPRIENCPYVFSITGRAPISGYSKKKRELDKVMGKPKPWRLHDLRRTAVTGMAELGIRPDVIELCVNHVSGVRRGVAGTYNKAELLDERRKALRRWALRIEGLTSGEQTKKVVRLRSH